MKSQNFSPFPWLAWAGILAGAVILRGYRLGSWSLWYDEAMTVREAESLARMPEILTTQPPLFPFLVHFWMKFSADEGWLRILSLLCGLGIVAAVGWLGTLIASKQVGMIATLLAASSPFLIFYSRELRAYSLFALLCVIQTGLLYLAARERERKMLWVLLSVASAAGVYASYITIFHLTVLSLWVVLFHRQVFLKMSGAMAGAAVLFLPWAGGALTNADRLMLKGKTWIPGISARRIFHLMKNLLTGFNGPRLIYWPLTFGLLALACWGMWRLWRRARQREAVLLGLWGCGVPAMLCGVSLLAPNSLVLERLFIGAVPGLMLAMAMGIEGLPKGWHRALLLLVILGGWSVSLQRYYVNHFPWALVLHHPSVVERQDFRESSRYVAERIQPGDLVGHTCPNSAQPFWYYFRYIWKKPLEQYNLDLDGSLTAEYFQQFAEKTVGITPVMKEVAGVVDARTTVLRYRRIWLIRSAWYMGMEDYFAAYGRRVYQWMGAHYTEEEAVSFKGIEVYRFELPVGEGK